MIIASITDDWIWVILLLIVLAVLLARSFW